VQTTSKGGSRQERGAIHLGGALTVLVLLIAVYLSVGAYGAGKWMKPRRNTDLSATPAAFGLTYQDVRIPSRESGIELSGWWIPRAGSAKAIVMVHGRGENRTSEFYSHFLDLGAKLNEFQGRGFNILMIELRAHGFSGGENCTWGVGERHDVEGAVDWVKQHGISPPGIGALGASLGATSSVYATADDPDISALVTDGAGIEEYPGIERNWTVTTGTPQFFFPAGVLMERLLYGYDIRTLRPIDAMKRIPPRPFLLIYGSKELPADSDRRRILNQEFPGANLWVVDGAAHTGAYTATPQVYLDKVGAFFETNLK